LLGTGTGDERLEVVAAMVSWWVHIFIVQKKTFNLQRSQESIFPL